LRWARRAIPPNPYAFLTGAYPALNDACEDKWHR
jgi:hypothetical protein